MTSYDNCTMCEDAIDIDNELCEYDIWGNLICKSCYEKLPAEDKVEGLGDE